MLRFILILALIIGALWIGTSNVQAAPVWRVAVLVYDSIDATCQGRTIRGSLVEGETDVQEALADLETQRQRIEAAGDGAITFTVIRAGTLTGELAPHGTDSCWPAPEDVAMPTGYDTVYVLYEADGDPEPGVNGYGGLSYACGGCPLYATQPIWDGGQDWFDGWYFVFIHEWGNNMTAWFQPQFGSTQVPSLYSDQSRYTFTNWYDDWYGGRLFDNQTGDYVGLEPHVWAFGTPTSGASPKPCKNPDSNAKACR